MNNKMTFWIATFFFVAGSAFASVACGDLDDGECDPEVVENCVCYEDLETEEITCELEEDNTNNTNNTNNAAPTSVSVQIETSGFVPASVRVAAGGSITFTNNTTEQVAPISSDTPPSIDVDPAINGGGSETVPAPNSAGTLTITDRIRGAGSPSMTITVVGG